MKDVRVQLSVYIVIEIRLKYIKKNSFNLFSCHKARSSISAAYFLTDVSGSKSDKPPKCLLHNIPR